MRIIVSSNLNNKYEKYVIVRSFNEVLSYKLEDIEMVIIHSFKESSFAASISVNNLYEKGINKILYLSSNMDEHLKLALAGVKGFCFDEEFYFENEEDLDALIDEINIEEEESLADTSAAIVEDFITSYASGDEKIKAPLYLDQVKQAVNELSATVAKKDYQIEVMGSSAIDILSSANKVIQQIKFQKEEVTQKLHNLEENYKSVNTVRPLMNNSLQFFPQINYMRTPILFLVREYSPCAFLTTFLLMYERYLSIKMHKRVKYIVLYKNSFCESVRYTNFGRIMEETKNMESLYANSYLAINIPKKDVMNKIFDLGGDVFIVLDRMYEIEDMITGRVKKLNAVGSVSDIKKFDLKKDETIFTILPKDTEFFFTLQGFGNYPSEFEAQIASYFSAYDKYFKKLDAFLGIKTTKGL